MVGFCRFDAFPYEYAKKYYKKIERSYRYNKTHLVGNAVVHQSSIISFFEYTYIRVTHQSRYNFPLIRVVMSYSEYSTQTAGKLSNKVHG